MISLPKQFSHTPIKMDSLVKSLPAVRETQFQSLSQEDTLEKEMATHSSILSWETPWTEEPGGLQPMELQRVRHDLATEHALMSVEYNITLNF